MKKFETRYFVKGIEFSDFVSAETWEEAETKKQEGHTIHGEVVEEIEEVTRETFIMNNVKKLLLIFLAIPLLAVQCETDEVELTTECDCDVEFWLSVPNTDINFWNGQEYSYPDNDCDNDGLILEDYNELGSDGTLYNIKKIVKCELIN